MKLNLEQIKKYIPHRDPFLFLDEVSIIDVSEDRPESIKDLEGAEVRASFFVKESLDMLRGHFPGNPVLPGVIQVEMMAQASIFTTYAMHKDPEAIKLKVALLSVNEAKFRRPVLPGMNLLIYTKLVKTRGQMLSFQASISDGDGVLSEASFLANFQVI